MTGELRAPVGGDIIRHSKAGDPVTDEGSQTGLSGGVGQWNGFRPPSETVDDRKEVLHALGLIKGAHQVNMEAAKTTVRWWSLSLVPRPSSLGGKNKGEEGLSRD